MPKIAASTTPYDIRTACTLRDTEQLGAGSLVERWTCGYVGIALRSAGLPGTPLLNDRASPFVHCVVGAVAPCPAEAQTFPQVKCNRLRGE